MIPVMVSERLNSRVVVTLPTTRRHRVPFSCRSTFLSCSPPCASRGERSRRGESTSDSHDLIIFFTLSRKGDRAAGTTAQRREEEGPGRRLFSTFLRLHFSQIFSSTSASSSPLPRPLFASSSLRDLIRCKKSGDAMPRRRRSLHSWLGEVT